MMEPEKLLEYTKEKSIKDLMEKKRFYEDKDTEPPAS